MAGHDTMVHLDTGSAVGLTLPVKFLAELPLASQPKEAGTVRTGGGEFPVSIARVNGTIELASTGLPLMKYASAMHAPARPLAISDTMSSGILW